MKLRICLEGVCFLKAFRFTAADLKRGLCFSSSGCRSVRGELAALASASMLRTELFLGLDSEAVAGPDPKEKLPFHSYGPSDAVQRHESCPLAWLQTNM